MEAPVGYRLVRIGQRGRLPTIPSVPEEELSDRQKKNFKYRMNNIEKRKEYAKQYYAKNRDKILTQMKKSYAVS
jgi:hypothetical protein